MLKDFSINESVLRVNHIIKYQNRPTIIFLHDSLGSIALWRDFPEKLSETVNCNVLVYDRLGYGESAPFATIERDNDYLEKEADVLDLLISEVGLTDVILFGHSDGASIALITAAKYPLKIKGLIVEGAHIFVEEVTLAGISAAVAAYESTDLGIKLQKYHGNKTDSVFRAWTNTWLSNKFKSWNIENFLPQISCPVLVIQGEGDEYGSIKQVKGIIGQVSGKAMELIIPSIGHTPHKEAAEIVLESSASFIRDII